MAEPTQAVVLAAGRGTRMRSDLPKVLHPLAGRPLLQHPVAAATEATGTAPIVVVSPDQADAISDLLGEGAVCVEQPHPLGTGDALRSVPATRRSNGTVLVLSGDVPLVRAATLRRLVEAREQSGTACAVLTVIPSGNGRGLGRVRRDETGAVAAIVEERDLPPGAPAPLECNAGIYAFDGSRLWPALERLRPDNAQGELYLTDVVALLAPALGLPAADPDEAIGVNDRVQLAAAERLLRRRMLDELMLSGVTVEDPATTYVDPTVRVGRDTVLRPLSVLRGRTWLGDGCEIGPMAQLRDVRAGDRVRIGASALDDCDLADDVEVGQYARIRPNTRLERGVHIGTHAEVKNSRVGAGTRINHFSCVLDSDVGSGVNVGAGTVTCNYDGEAKHRTVIGDGVFVGSDSILVAPLRIGAGAYIGAGSVVSKDVPDGALAVERAEQRTLEGWAARRRARAAAAAQRAL